MKYKYVFTTFFIILSLKGFSQEITLDASVMHRLNNYTNDSLINSAIGATIEEKYIDALQLINQIDLKNDTTLSHACLYLKAYCLNKMNKKQTACNLWKIYLTEKDSLSIQDSIIYRYCAYEKKPVNQLETFKEPEYIFGKDSMVNLMQLLNYPPDAIYNKVSGEVKLLLHIDKQGSLTKVDILNSPNEILSTPIITNLFLLRNFKPGYLNGNSIDTTLNLNFLFNIVVDNEEPTDENKADYFVSYIIYKKPITFGFVNNAYEDIEKSEYHFGLGVKLLKQKNYSEAIEKFDMSIKHRSTNINALYNRGICYFYLNDIESACIDWQKAGLMGDVEAGNMFLKNCP